MFLCIWSCFSASTPLQYVRIYIIIKLNNDYQKDFFSSHFYQSPSLVRKEVTNKFSAEIWFYLYPLESFPSFWGPQSSCDHSKILTAKHDGYIHAIQAMKRHPWRTSNPHKAMLAILPLSLDLYSRGQNKRPTGLNGTSSFRSWFPSESGGGCPGLGLFFSAVASFASDM